MAPSSEPAESWIAFQASLYLISRVLTTGDYVGFHSDLSKTGAANECLIAAVIISGPPDVLGTLFVFPEGGKESSFHSTLQVFFFVVAPLSIALNVARRCHKLLIIDIDPARIPTTPIKAVKGRKRSSAHFLAVF